MRGLTVALALSSLLVLTCAAPTPMVAQAIFHRESTAAPSTSELMNQVLAAVSTKSDDTHATMEKLCMLVNQVEQSVRAMNDHESTEFDYTVAHLQSELLAARQNLTSVKLQLNQTMADIRSHSLTSIPDQLEDLQRRERALSRQRDLLMTECQEDVEGQRLRVDAVKADLSILDQALSHLTKLQEIGSKSETALIEINTEVEKCDRALLDGPIAQCDNGYVVSLTADSGALSTFPPGNGMAYHNRIRCAFHIAPSNAGYLDRVVLTIQALQAFAPDFVKIYEGNVADESRLLAAFSGTDLPPSIQTKTQTDMTVIFELSGNEAAAGFTATYTTVKVPLGHSSAINRCAASNGDAIILTGDGGSIAEDARPEFADALQSRAGTVYRGPMACSWEVHALPGQQIRFHFTFLHTESDEHVTIFDGVTHDAPIAVQATGTIPPNDVITSSVARITYNGDYSISGNGFHFTWCVVGKDCPALPDLVLPSPVPKPVVQFNETAPEPAPVTPEPVTGTVVPPPEYPAPFPAPVENTCCPANCNARGICNPTTCICACYSGFDGVDCSTSSATPEFLELDSGDNTDASTVALIEDECGDQVGEDDETGVQSLNVDPLKSLLDKLRYELFRSLSYEHDTTNSTKRRCTEELRGVDRQLDDLQQQTLSLNKAKSDAEAYANVLAEKRDALALSSRSIQDYITELSSRINSRQNARTSRLGAMDTEVKTLDSMRAIITELGGFPCTRDMSFTPTFNRTDGVECFGELLELQHPTDDPEDCQALCDVGCVAFTFNTALGCRFFSSVEKLSPACSGNAVACSCYVRP